MALTQGEGSGSPWITLWLSPRQTIEHIVATQPRHLVWLLAILGTMAGFYSQLVNVGAAGQLLDWRFWLGFLLISAVFGLIWLYLNALMLSWIGKLLGGRAPALALRAVVAWSTVPAIVGSVVVLIIGAMGGASPAMQDVLALLDVCFGFWSLVVFLLMLARIEHFGFWRTIATFLLNLIVLALAVAILIRTLLYQPFSIPAASMSPTLLVGDYVFVSKFAYGYSRYSVPFSPPLFSGRILASEPERGDVVVFRAPKDTAADYVKRVVGLGGDRIQMKQGLLYINEVAVKRERLADFTGADLCGSAPNVTIKRWRETLPNGKSYETLDCVDNGFYDNTKIYTVPPGHVFVLGDNRDNSVDSRVESSMGPVPLENLVGRARLVFFSHAAGSAGAAPSIRTERIGMVVR